MTATPAGITPAQYAQLVAPIAAGRVQHLRGQSHMEQWDIRRQLIRIFGFGGYDIDTLSCDQVAQLEYAPGAVKKSNGSTNDRVVWTVVYRAQVRLTVKAPDGTPVAHFEDGATGDSQNQPSLGDAHDQAMKTALSQALKRCAVNLGDQFGLSLYNGGKSDPVVLGSLVRPDGKAEAPALPADEKVEPEPSAQAPTQAQHEEPAEPDFPKPAPAIGPTSDPSDVRKAIVAAGTAKRLSISEIAEDFFEWTKGEQIGTSPSALLFEYLQHLQAGKAAA